MNVLVLNIMKQELRGANGVQQAERIALSVNPAVAGRGWSVCLPVSRSLCHIFLKRQERFTSFRALVLFFTTVVYVLFLGEKVQDVYIKNYFVYLQVYLYIVSSMSRRRVGLKKRRGMGCEGGGGLRGSKCERRT